MNILRKVHKESYYYVIVFLTLSFLNQQFLSRKMYLCTLAKKSFVYRYSKIN